MYGTRMFAGKSAFARGRTLLLTVLLGAGLVSTCGDDDVLGPATPASTPSLPTAEQTAALNSRSVGTDTHGEPRSPSQTETSRENWVGGPNRPPTVDIVGSDVTVAGGGTVTFSTEATDPDGDPLSYAWTQSQQNPDTDLGAFSATDGADDLDCAGSEKCRTGTGDQGHGAGPGRHGWEQCGDRHGASPPVMPYCWRLVVRSETRGLLPSRRTQLRVSVKMRTGHALRASSTGRGGCVPRAFYDGQLWDSGSGQQTDRRSGFQPHPVRAGHRPPVPLMAQPPEQDPA